MKPSTSRPQVAQFYWEARPLELDSYAGNLLTILNSLGETSTALSCWIADDESLMVRTPETDWQRVQSHLVAHRERWKHAGRHYSASLTSFHNGRIGPAATRIALRCGITQPSTTLWFANYLTLEFKPGADGELWSLDHADHIFRLICEILLPRWASLGPVGFPQRTVDDELAGCPIVAARLYLAPSIPAPAVMPPPSQVERWENRASLIRVVPGWFNPADDEQLRAWQQAHAALSSVGSLRPMADAP